MAEINREIVEGDQYVGLNESPRFKLTTTNWGSSPTTVSVFSYSYNKTTQVYTLNTSTIFPSGSASVSGDVITLPALVPQAVGDMYEVHIKFTAGGSVWEAILWVIVTR
jgi:hypothetical protein